MMKKKFLYVCILLFMTLCMTAQQRLWVGQTYRCDATSAVMGLTSDLSWSGDACLSLTGSGFYRDVVIVDYFEGTQTVTCSWNYRLYSNDTWKRQTKTWNISCYENPLTVSPTTMTLYVGQEDYVGYSHQYTNGYSGSARVTFSTTNSRVVSVSGSGKVSALSPGTAYVNVHSTLSSGAPYCFITVKEATVTGVTLPGTLKVIEGETKRLVPSVSPSGASTSFTWESENPDIATVDSDGMVTGIKVGTAKIWVTTVKGGYKSSCIVTVVPPPVQPTGVVLPEKTSLYKGFKQKLTPSLVPGNAEATYTWKSSDTNVVTVDASGNITAKKAGTSIITVTTHNGVSATCEVTVNDLPEEYNADALKSKMNVIEKLRTATLNKLY